MNFQQEVKRLIAKRKLHPPQAGGIIFIGSSIFRLWKTLEEDMKPLPITNQAFGGSKTCEVLNYADKLVIPYRPQIVVYYCGSNDINMGKNAQEIKQGFEMFVLYTRANLPQTQFLFVGINRAPQKQSKWHVVDAANNLIEKYCEETTYLKYVEVNHLLVDSGGKPRPNMFESDRVHLKPAAYQEFTKIIKPILEDSWNGSLLN